jgi:ABC-2 type transport system ATP-binding protein
MLSSHLMSEMALIADHLVIIGGRLLADTSLKDFTHQAGGSGVKVATGEAMKLRELLTAPGATVSSSSDQELLVHGRAAQEIGLVVAPPSWRTRPVPLAHRRSGQTSRRKSCSVGARTGTN